MIEDARVLRDEFVPREVEHRDPEVNHLASVLAPITDGRPTAPRASRLGVLEQGMTREAVERALAAERDDDRIPLKPSREFDVIAKLIDDGNLPFAPHPVAEDDLRAAPSSIDLREYQERA